MSNLNITGNLTIDGEITNGAQCLNRVKIMTTSDSSAKYYPILKFKYPYTEAGDNSCSVTVWGTMGGWVVYDDTGYICGICGNRSVEIGCFAVKAKNVMSTLNRCRLVMYRDSDGYDTLYVLCATSWCKVDLNLQYDGDRATYLFNGTYTTTPSGTEVWSMYKYLSGIKESPSSYHEVLTMTGDNGTYQWTNPSSNGRNVIVRVSAQCYQNVLQIFVNNNEVRSWHALTNNERTLVSDTVFLRPGDTIKVVGYRTNNFNYNQLHITEYTIN